MNPNSTYYHDSRVLTSANLISENILPSPMGKIEIKNSKIINFYSSNPNINIEEINLYFINLIQNILPHNVAELSPTNILSTIHRENVDKIQVDKPNFPKSEFNYILSQLYPSADINIVNNIISMKRLQKPRIIMKSMCEESNISIETIGEFVDLIDTENCNGIIFSQNSGISNKKNFQIDYNNKNIIVYVHNVKWSHFIINSAIDIIDNLSAKLQSGSKNNSENQYIPIEILDNINSEYNLFISKKMELIETMKEYHKKMLSQVEDCRFVSLNTFLSEKYSVPLQKSGFICNLCNKYSGHNLKAVAAHKRGCNRKKQQV